MIRAQYHFRESPEGLLAWDVRELVRASESFEPFRVPVEQIAELDENHWYQHAKPTCRSILEHCALIEAADLNFPIILDASGRVMDGMHRVCKAVRSGLPEIACVQFTVDPPPDYVGVAPQDLPYDDDP
ncbi:MAG: hypothetical protein AAGG11_22195 [Pseudomonadota bacterium]